jgi:alkanesulfonate monooxygenase SsuD/methylene tetrahydromethanopterin reductase-like flavin-dependent oxidoreductase (luciferase family)
MAKSLGISLAPFSGIPYPDLTRLACEAEDTGFSGVFIPEAANDGLMCCYAIARATSRITIATWIVNIYFREPALCAAASEMVQTESGGRFILGLGVSHRPAMESLGIQMGNARDRLRAYTAFLRKALAGEPVGAFGRAYRKPAKPVPIYFAALALETARLGGEIADGLMLYLASPERMRASAAVAHAAARAAGRKPSDVAITVGVPAFIDDDRVRALDAARRALSFYASLPFYNRLLARSGFAAEAARVMEAAKRRDASAMAAALTDKMADTVALIGPPARCVERLAEYRAAGAELPIIVPNQVGDDYLTTVRKALKVFTATL